MYPKLKLKIDVEYDIKNAVEVLKTAKEWERVGNNIKWFLSEEIRFILDDKFSKMEKIKILEAYTRNIYKNRNQEIKKYFSIVKDKWEKIEADYFKVLDKAFDGYSWPKGLYIGYATIFNVYTRNIKDKSFIFPYIHQNMNYPVHVIAHEMIHFLFFDFVKKSYGLSEDDEIKGKSQEYLWQVSEVFNNVIEDWEPYRKVVGAEPSLYHGKVKMFEKMKEQWAQKQDIKWFLDQWLL